MPATGGEPGPASTAGAVAAGVETASAVAANAAGAVEAVVPKGPEAGVVNAPQGDSPVAIRKPLSMTLGETTVRLEGIKAVHDAGGAGSLTENASLPEGADGTAPDTQPASPGEAGAADPVDKVIAAVTKELAGQEPN